MSVFNNAKNFIYRNARPLDFARYRFHFENSNIDNVLSILSAYQNVDGGFAYGLEPDNWNENSNPVATWTATTILNEIGFADSAHPIIKGILEYLDSGKDFADGKWFNVIPSNNTFPHAVWWHCNDEKGIPDDNPTVSLAGFALKHSKKDSRLYKKAEEIICKCVTEFINNPTSEHHTLRNYAELYNYCKSIDNFSLFNLQEFEDILSIKINEVICKDTSKWQTEYVCTPSQIYIYNGKSSDFIDRELIGKETEIILNSQLPDGSYPVTWQWYTDYKEFEISANWWKSSLLIKTLLYLRDFNKLS